MENMKAESIATYYEADHNRLDELFKQFQKLKRVDFAKAKPFFRDFKIGLQRHIVWEEDILFPLFEKKTGMGLGGPTDVMRMEHRQIKKHLEDIHDKVRVKNPDSDIDEQLLGDVLRQHNLKEEKILYLAIDKNLSDAERVEIFAAMKKIPEERYHRCC